MQGHSEEDPKGLGKGVESGDPLGFGAPGGGDGPIHSWASGFGAQEGLLGAGPAQMSAVRIFWRQVAFADQLILSKALNSHALSPCSYRV